MTLTAPTQDELEGRTPLRSDARLYCLLQYLVKSAIQRQIWLFFFDASDRVITTIVRLNDHPIDPDELHDTEDIGLETFPRIFVQRARQVAEMKGGASFVIIWERAGNDRFTTDDLRWLRSLFDSAANRCAGEARLRALFLLHDQGLRPVAPDDLL